MARVLGPLRDRSGTSGGCRSAVSSTRGDRLRPERVRELKTWISEDAGPGATIDAALAVARYFGIDARRATDIVAAVEAAVARWRDEGRALGMTERELDAFADAFEHAERRAAQQLGS